VVVEDEEVSGSRTHRLMASPSVVERRATKVQARWGALYEQFRYEVSYWSLCQLALFAVLAGCSAGFGGRGGIYPGLQAWISSFALFSVAVVIEVLRPFRDTYRNHVSAAAMIGACIATLLNWAVADGPLVDIKYEISLVLVACMVLFVLVGSVVLIRFGYRRLARMRRNRVDVRHSSSASAAHHGTTHEVPNLRVSVVLPEDVNTMYASQSSSLPSSTSSSSASLTSSLSFAVEDDAPEGGSSVPSMNVAALRKGARRGRYGRMQTLSNLDTKRNTDVPPGPKTDGEGKGVDSPRGTVSLRTLQPRAQRRGRVVGRRRRSDRSSSDTSTDASPMISPRVSRLNLAHVPQASPRQRRSYRRSHGRSPRGAQTVRQSPRPDRAQLSLKNTSDIRGTTNGTDVSPMVSPRRARRRRLNATLPLQS